MIYCVVNYILILMFVDHRTRTVTCRRCSWCMTQCALIQWDQERRLLLLHLKLSTFTWTDVGLVVHKTQRNPLEKFFLDQMLIPRMWFLIFSLVSLTGYSAACFCSTYYLCCRRCICRLWFLWDYIRGRTLLSDEWWFTRNECAELCHSIREPICEVHDTNK